jgi:hypothetical protein
LTLWGGAAIIIMFAWEQEKKDKLHAEAVCRKQHQVKA